MNPVEFRELIKELIGNVRRTGSSEKSEYKRVNITEILSGHTILRQGTKSWCYA